MMKLLERGSWTSTCACTAVPNSFMTLQVVLLVNRQGQQQLPHQEIYFKVFNHWMKNIYWNSQHQKCNCNQLLLWKGGKFYRENFLQRGEKKTENAPGIVSRFLPSGIFRSPVTVNMVVNVNGPLYYRARPQSCIISIWRAVGVDFGESAYLFLISQPHLKSSNFARRPPFHVDAIDLQTSGGKMLIILTWACGKALLSDLKFQLMNWSTASLSRWDGFIPNKEPLSQAVPHLIPHSHAHLPITIILFCLSWRVRSGFSSKASCWQTFLRNSQIKASFSQICADSVI